MMKYNQIEMLKHLFAAILFLVAQSIGASSVVADEFQLSLDDGSVITVDVSNEAIQWTDVLENGDMVQKAIQFSNIKQLVLSKSPASKQVAEIRQYLNMLENEDYLSRQEAEERLSDPKVGGRFASLIRIRSDHPNFEVRYRIGRILDRLDSDSEETTSEFDQLTLKDGTIVEGDAGEFVLKCKYRGNQASFKRADIRLVSLPIKPRQMLAADEKVKVKMIHSHKKEFFKPGQVLIDFENAPNGAELTRQMNVNDIFIPFGLRLDTEQVGYIGISGYPFKFSPLPVSGNSICVFETVGTYAKRFKGVTEIRFCMPNQASVPAGVNEIGMFIARVNHSRDFLLEAYNADDELLASVESTDQPCVFSGVKSNEPITKIRILSNPYLFRIDRVIDEDYGIDSISFSPPVPVLTPVDSEPGIRLKNGDLIKGKKVSIGDATISIELEDGGTMKINWDEIQTIRFDNGERKAKGAATRPMQKRENFWMAILKDRSTIRVTAGTKFRSTTFPNLSYKVDDLLGFKASRNVTRYPSAGDFEFGDRVAVFPTCRIASKNLKFTPTGFEWDAKDKKLEQPVHTTEDEDGEQDPTPPFNKIEFAKSGSESTPTVWFAPPKGRPQSTGRLRLVDGQQLTLGGEAGFEITKFSSESVTVTVGGEATEIPLKKILSIDFPVGE